VERIENQRKSSTEEWYRKMCYQVLVYNIHYKSFLTHQIFTMSRFIATSQEQIFVVKRLFFSLHVE
jgi:hypothetical protein